MELDWREAARTILHIDPDREPARARLSWESHLRQGGRAVFWDAIDADAIGKPHQRGAQKRVLRDIDLFAVGEAGFHPLGKNRGSRKPPNELEPRFRETVVLLKGADLPRYRRLRQSELFAGMGETVGLRGGVGGRRAGAAGTGMNSQEADRWLHCQPGDHRSRAARKPLAK